MRFIYKFDKDRYSIGSVLKISKNLSRLRALRICFSRLFQDTFYSWNTHLGTCMGYVRMYNFFYLYATVKSEIHICSNKHETGLVLRLYICNLCQEYI